MDITQTIINQFSGNTTAESAGRKLAKNGDFTSLGQSADASVLWGLCRGSGAEPYEVSVDFIDPEHPVGRCNCPSRQRPCKHSIGLLYARLAGQVFKPGDIPEKVNLAREKGATRAEKDIKPVVMTKAKAGSEAKKCATQIEGIELAEKIIHNIVLTGMDAIADAALSSYEAQIKELGSYYITGIQAGFTELVTLIQAGQVDKCFGKAIEKIVYLSALLSRATAYLSNKKADFEAFPAMTGTANAEMLGSSLEEQIGYAWKLSELRDKGRFRTDAELLQVAFSIEEDDVRKHWVDRGVWLSLTDDAIYVTEKFRPYKAKNLLPEDSFHKILTSNELYIYPGDKNPRIRWEKSAWREIEPADFAHAQSAAATNFADVIKAVKQQIRYPLKDKEPLYALSIARMGSNADDTVSVFDGAGTRLILKASEGLRRLSREQVEGQTLIVQFKQDIDGDLLYAVPLSMVTATVVIRFMPAVPVSESKA
jgi:uncharacterized Zn finger protein